MRNVSGNKYKLVQIVQETATNDHVLTLAIKKDFNALYQIVLIALYCIRWTMVRNLSCVSKAILKCTNVLHIQLFHVFIFLKVASHEDTFNSKQEHCTLSGKHFPSLLEFDCQLVDKSCML